MIIDIKKPVPQEKKTRWSYCLLPVFNGKQVFWLEEVELEYTFWYAKDSIYNKLEWVLTGIKALKK